MRKTITVMLLLAAVLAAGCGPRLPEEMTFGGARLEKATSWSRGKISGVVFVPPGEELETASLQVGIISSREHSSGSQLHAWVMEQYHQARVAPWHESATADEACKVGLPADPPPRPFVALQVCRTGKAAAVCAEADEQISDELTARCLDRGWGCWDELCTQKWNAWRAPLESIVAGVAVGR